MRVLPPSLCVIACVIALLLALPCALRAQDPEYLEDVASAQAEMWQGKLSRARAGFEEVLAAYAEEEEADKPPLQAWQLAQQGLLRLDLMRGRYKGVLATAATLPADLQAMVATQLLVSQAQMQLGQYAEIISKLQAVHAGRAKAGAAQSFQVAHLLATAMQESGQRPASRKVLQDAVQLGEKEDVRDPLDLCYLAQCRMALGGRKNLEMASALLVESIRLAPERPEARTAYGLLNFMAYRERSGFPSGEKSLKKVLEFCGDHEEALLGLYRLRSSNMNLDPAITEDYLQRALARNPNSVPALELRGSNLIDDRRFDAAVRMLEQALHINPKDKRLLAHRAAVAHLLRDTEGFAKYRDAAYQADAEYVDLNRIVADHLVALYRFADALPFYSEALARDPKWVPALHGMAKALIYTGDGDRAARLLKQAVELEEGLAHPWRNNMLVIQELLGDEYDVVERGHFRLLLHKEDRAVLEKYLLAWHEDAYTHLGRKYGYLPKEKVRVEVLHRWLDFSVRTIGFRGFTALGACFGPFITLVSPGDDDLRINDFMWSATVWHEYTHVLTLALSKQRVPRWLTEGLSVYEESSKNPSWERGMQRELLNAWHNGDIAPVRLLNRLFRGPRILFGYYQGGLIVEYLAAEHGFGKVVSMLRAYGEDQSTESIFQNTFGISTREFDRDFKEWVWQNKLQQLQVVPDYGDKAVRKLQNQLLLTPEDLDVRRKLAWAFVRRQNPIDAGIQLSEVLRRQPDDAMGKLLHGELLALRKQDEAAITALQEGFKAGANAFDSRLLLGRLLEKKGDLDAALRQYQAAKGCWPRCTEVQSSPALRVARILRKQDKEAESMMEMKAFCRLTARAFKPRLRLAAYAHKQGNREEQVRFLLEALQIDPFMRQLHVDLADAYMELERPADAVEEYTVALAVPEARDRAYLGMPAEERPKADDPAQAEARAEICVKLAQAYWDLQKRDAAGRFLDQAQAEAGNGDAAKLAAELRLRWGL